MKNYSLSNTCIGILKSSKNGDEASKKITNEILANAIFTSVRIAYSNLKHFYNKNIVEPREDIKKLIRENETHNTLLAQQVQNQNELLRSLRVKGII